MPELLNNPYFVLFLAVLVGGLGYVIRRPETIPAFLFLLMAAIESFYDLANIEKVSLLKAILLPTLMAVLALRKFRYGERMPREGFIWITLYGLFVVFSCVINGTNINQYRASLGILLLPLVMALCPNNEKTVKSLTVAIAFWGLVNLLVAAATFAGLGWAKQFVTSDTTNMAARLQGLMGHSSLMGIYFVISLNAVHVLFYQAKTKLGRRLLLVLGVGMALALVGTVSIGAFVGWGVSFLFIQYRLRGLSLGNLMVIGMLAALLLGLSALLKMDTIVARMSSLSSDVSALDRLMLLHMGTKLFFQNPVFGVSLGQGGRMHLEAHNTYMQVLMENGIVGFALFCTVIWKGLRGLRWRAGWDKPTELTPMAPYYIGLLGTMIAILVDGAVHVCDYLMPLWLILGIGFMV